jgi:non-heme chloroperoxidase
LSRNLRVGADGRYYWHWDPDFLPSDSVMAPEALFQRFEAAARNVKVPTLHVRGSMSEIVDEEGIRHFLSLIPSARFVDVVGAAHMVAGDKNDAFNQAVIAFLASIGMP